MNLRIASLLLAFVPCAPAFAQQQHLLSGGVQVPGINDKANYTTAGAGDLVLDTSDHSFYGMDDQGNWLNFTAAGQPAGPSQSGYVTFNSTQTFGGDKVFNGSIQAAGGFDTTGGAGLATSTAPGLVSTTTQTLAGNKTWSGISSLSGQPGGTQYRNTATAGINPNTTPAPVAMTTTEFDNASNFSAGIFTVPAGGGGKYLVSGAANLAAGTSLDRIQFGILKNGGAYMILSDENGLSIGSGKIYTVQGTIALSLAAGDTIQLFVLATGSGNYTIQGGSIYNTYISVMKLF